MNREILVQVADEETKVAVVENGQLVEMYVERTPDQRLIGNIYKGVVHNVLPGMQAAFVDIGLERNAFLYVEDALSNNMKDLGVQFNKEQRPSICDIVKEGQEIVVQIAKEPVGTKGARVTTQLTLPGRFLVLMPTVDYIGISRRIEDEEERDRLKTIAQDVKPADMGVIVRTVAEGVSREEMEQDIDQLYKIWQRLKQRCVNTSGPSLIHRDIELVQRILRDLFNDDVYRLCVNSRSVLERVLEYLEITDAHLKGKVFLCDTDNLFDKYAIEQEIYQALKRKVWLKSGGYLVIDEMEALTVVDVNTGKFVGTKNLADTVLKTNIEAAGEIARQLRLRNIGGIIIVDFIDMTTTEDKEEVLRVLSDALKRDKVKAHILGITALGLVEMTRKKVRQTLSTTLERSCPYCEGKGRILSEETVYINLKEELREIAARSMAEYLVLECNPHVAAYLIGPGGENQKIFENEIKKKLIIKGKEQYHVEKYDIKPLYNEVKNEQSVAPVEEGQIIKTTITHTHVHVPQDGIARLGGYVVQVEDGARLLGETLFIEIIKVYNTHAKARVIF